MLLLHVVKLNLILTLTVGTILHWHGVSYTCFYLAFTFTVRMHIFIGIAHSDYAKNEVQSQEELV